MYIINLVSALNLLDDSDKPEILIYYQPESPIDDLLAIDYPYLKCVLIEQFPVPVWKKVINLALLKFAKRSIFSRDRPDVVYPYVNFLGFGKPIYWIPDFQEYYLPEMFTREDINARKDSHQKLSTSESKVVFSSIDAMGDFKTFYPNYRNKLFLLRFACSHPRFKHLDINSLTDKFRISKPYFLVPNQFWKHKNHKVILEAISLLKGFEINFQVVFTGSTSDFRNKDYYTSLISFVNESNIQKYVRFLGFIDRREQLRLMEDATAIVQPSLFEGWSTVVEDAKALSQSIILSDIGVHREQIDTNCKFFSPDDPLDLSKIMEAHLKNPPKRVFQDYESNLKDFARQFIEIVKKSD